MQSYRGVRNSAASAMFILVGFLSVGCAGTRPSSANESEESPLTTELAEAPIVDAAVAEHASDPAEIDSQQGASADECNADEAPEEQAPKPDCVETVASDEALLDRTQSTVFGVMNSTTQMFDGLFGEVPLYEGPFVTRGRATISPTWDQRDGFDLRFRLRARYTLPALQNRARLVLGRGDTDDIVDGSANDAIEGLPGSFDDNVDDDWLIGLGFSRSGNSLSGFDIGAGVRLSTPLDPYVHLTYRWYKPLGDKWNFRARPRLFWQDTRGTGVTVDSDLDYAINSSLMLRWANNFAVEERVEGLGWRSDIFLYQGLTNERGLAYGVFADIETDAEVELQNTGFDIRYRRRFAREWFFIQFSAGVSWPRELLIEERESNIGVGVSFEMRFGQW